MARTRKNVVEYRIYDLPVDMPIICLSGDAWKISDTLSNRLHFHNCMEIGICHTDSGILVFEGETVPFEAGDVVIIPRHVPHTTCSRKGTRSLWSYVFVDLPALTRAQAPAEGVHGAEGDAAAPYYKASGEINPRLSFLANCLLRELLDAREDMEPMLRIYGLALMSELDRLKSEFTSRGARESGKAFVLKPVLEYINRHYMDECDTPTLAGICHLSQTHFRRVFLSIMGTSPLQFITATRINQACVLLDTTEEPVMSIAQTVGISSISSFNRSFQQIMGVSPREYRRSSTKRTTMRERKYILPYKGWLRAEERPAFTGEE